MNSNLIRSLERRSPLLCSECPVRVISSSCSNCWICRFSGVAFPWCGRASPTSIPHFLLHGDKPLNTILTSLVSSSWGLAALLSTRTASILNSPASFSFLQFLVFLRVAFYPIPVISLPLCWEKIITRIYPRCCFPGSRPGELLNRVE